MLTLAQQNFIQASLAGENIGEAAATANVDRRTASRWLKLPDVQQALAKEVKQRADTAREIIHKHYTDDLEASCLTVQQIMLDPEAPHASRLKAAQMIQDRLLADSGESEQEAEEKTPAINWIIFTPEELAIILPIFERAEKRVVEANK